MASYWNPNEIRASASGFAWGEIVFSEFKSACLRKILVHSVAEMDQTIDPKYTFLGKFNEDRHERMLTAVKLPFVREKDFKRPVATVPEVNLSGHIDFVVEPVAAPKWVDELKSMLSKNQRRVVIKNGQYVTENLAQLICYMVEEKTPNGRLIYTFYEPETRDGVTHYEATDGRTFVVKIDDYGRIHVDGKPSKFTVHDMLAHQVAAAKVVRDRTVGARPDGYDKMWGSPCTFCPYQRACESYDRGEIESSEAFVTLAKKGKENSNDD